MQIIQERPEDAAAIRQIVDAAFRGMPHSDQSESRIVDALREAGALTVSLVAVREGEIVGHVAFSPVQINRIEGDWFGLGPVAVRPDMQRQGIGQALIRGGLERLGSIGAGGCVVLGDPGYYGRFGFVSDPGLWYDHVPPGYFQRLIIAGDRSPKGEVTYHPAFGT